ncbi:MAG: hypothetical protein ABSF27_02165 [Candidatus Dormibacteria bacterium]|jgi:hypothetical protein
MVGVAAACGVALGSAIALLLRRERQVQLVALGILSLALAAAFALAGATLPALGELLLGAVAEVVLLAPSARVKLEGEAAPGRGARRAALVLPFAAGGGAAGLLVGAGLASRTQLVARLSSAPSLAEVGHQLVMGAGVAAVIVALLAVTTVAGGAALSQRDPREAAEEQLQLARRRRLEAQRRRQAHREAARAAARAARRRGGP